MIKNLSTRSDFNSQFSILHSLVTEDDFAKAAGVAKVMVEG